MSQYIEYIFGLLDQLKVRLSRVPEDAEDVVLAHPVDKVLLSTAVRYLNQLIKLLDTLTAEGQGVRLEALFADLQSCLYSLIFFINLIQSVSNCATNLIDVFRR